MALNIIMMFGHTTEFEKEKRSHGKEPFNNDNFYLHLFDGVRFQYSQVLVVFLFSENSDSFLVWQLYSFRYLGFFLTFDYKH